MMIMMITDIIMGKIKKLEILILKLINQNLIIKIVMIMMKKMRKMMIIIKNPLKKIMQKNHLNLDKKLKCHIFLKIIMKIRIQTSILYLLLYTL